MARWRNYFFRILNVHGVNDVKHTEIQAAEPLVPEPNVFEFELPIEDIKSHKSPGIGQVAGELFKVGSRKFSNEFHSLFGIRRIA